MIFTVEITDDGVFAGCAYAGVNGKLDALGDTLGITVGNILDTGETGFDHFVESKRGIEVTVFGVVFALIVEVEHESDDTVAAPLTRSTVTSSVGTRLPLSVILLNYTGGDPVRRHADRAASRR